MHKRKISDDDLHLGIDVLDSEHRQLLALTRRLLAACDQESDPRSIDGIAADLVACVRDHMRSEETQMAAWDYGGIDIHKAAHDRLFAALEAILRPVRQQPGLDISDDILGFLMTWLDEHILGEDKLFADFLKERGVE
jgi:hemerythrin